MARIGLITLLLAASHGYAAPYSFGAGQRLADAQALPNWHAALARHQAERGNLRLCLGQPNRCIGVERSLRHLLSRAATLPLDRRVRLINGFVNHRRYRVDRRIESTDSLNTAHKLRTHWSTLMEFLRRGGDCEDYASAKYFLLRELGVPANELRIVVTTERRVRGNHAVVAWQHPGGEVWLLDMDKIHRGKHSGFRYRYALNEQSIWDYEFQKSS